jgi:hypothetical protein
MMQRMKRRLAMPRFVVGWVVALLLSFRGIGIADVPPSRGEATLCGTHLEMRIKGDPDLRS